MNTSNFDSLKKKIKIESFRSDFRNNTNNFTNTNGVGYERAIHMDDDDDSPNVASDIDSQVNNFVKFYRHRLMI